MHTINCISYLWLAVAGIPIADMVIHAVAEQIVDKWISIGRESEYHLRAIANRCSVNIMRRAPAWFRWIHSIYDMHKTDVKTDNMWVILVKRQGILYINRMCIQSWNC